jgi:hypothetical protein
MLVWGCTDPGCQVSIATKFCMVVPNIGRSLVLNLLHGTPLMPRTVRKLLDFWRTCTSCVTVVKCMFFASAKLCAVRHILEIVFGNVTGFLFNHPEFT